MKEKRKKQFREVAEDWANRIINGEDFKKEFQSRLDKEFLDYVTYGKSIFLKEKDGNFEPISSEEVEEFLSNPNVVSEDYKLDADSIANKFSGSLNAEDKNIRDKRK